MGRKTQTGINGRAQVERIIAVFNRATPDELAEGLHWYQTANTFAHGLSEKYGVTVRQASAILAVVSPQVSWEQNQIIADAICAKRKRVGNALGANVTKARRILGGEEPDLVLGHSERTGKKVRAFFACIAEPDSTEAVCIDRHAWDLAEGIFHNTNEARGSALRRIGVYEACAQSYVRAAKVLGVHPNQAQAVSWVVWRNLKRALRVQEASSSGNGIT